MMSTPSELRIDAPSLPLVSNRWRLAAWGSFFLLLALYLFSHPGRIDIIDGQFRFEVSKNMLNFNGPMLSDYYLIQGALPTNAATGHHYSYYTAPASLFPLPFMLISRVLLGSGIASDQFTFSITSAFAGACIAPLLIAFYRRLRVPLLPALGWTAIFSVATLWWPGSETVFDQCQHGVVILAMTLTAYDVAKNGRLGGALTTGLLGGLLFNYRIPFITLLPLFPVYWLIEARRKVDRTTADRNALILQMVVFCAGVGVGLAGYAFYNWVRFGSISAPPFAGEQPAIGNPIAGFLTLIVSPGKGLLWFSPSIFLAFFGLKGFLKAERGLALLIITLSIMHVGEMSLLTFAGGDWCWGPRYMLPILPLWALFFPYISFNVARKRIAYFLVGAGLFSQLLGVSMDQHRFFFFRRLAPHFWQDPWAYFRFSQLAARPGEVLESFLERDRKRPYLNSNPLGQVTYCPFGPPGQPQKPKDASAPPPKPKIASPKERAAWEALMGGKPPLHFPKRSTTVKRTAPDPREWMKDFGIFYLPRPWWGWIGHTTAKERPVDARAFFAFCCAFGGLGAGLLTMSIKSPKEPTESFDQ